MLKKKINKKSNLDVSNLTTTLQDYICSTPVTLYTMSSDPFLMITSSLSSFSFRRIPKEHISIFLLLCFDNPLSLSPSSLLSVTIFDRHRRIVNISIFILVLTGDSIDQFPETRSENLETQSQGSKYFTFPLILRRS